MAIKASRYHQGDELGVGVVFTITDLLRRYEDDLPEEDAEAFILEHQHIIDKELRMAGWKLIDKLLRDW